VFFALTGVAYLGWVLPLMAARLAPLEEAVDLAAWIFYCVAVVPQLLFIRVVFRQQARWAIWVVLGCGAALGVSTTVLTLNGNQYPGFGDPSHWARWLGYTVPCIWMSLEAFLSHRTARRRAQIGLSDLVVANRYLLLALFGLLQTLACLSDILIDLDPTSVWALSSFAGDVLLGGLEIAGIATLWLAFFPPASYLAWVAGPKPAADRAG
jgi:hypothetical protein